MKEGEMMMMHERRCMWLEGLWEVNKKHENRKKWIHSFIEQMKMKGGANT